MPQRMGLAEGPKGQCEMLADIYSDSIHPTLKGQVRA